MSTISILIESFLFNRTRTMQLLDKIATENESALGWRPGPGRAHLAWQFMHIAVTEEVFATERLNPSRQPRQHQFWARFRGGSTPDDQIPTSSTIREVLSDTRNSLLETLHSYDDSRLTEIPASLKERGWTVRTVLDVISWHESHHQGQAHITYNLFKASQT